MSELRLDAVTRRYTAALFDLAQKKGAGDDVRRDVELLGRELAVPAVETYLFDTRIPLEDRRAKLAPVLSGMHTLTQNFISLLFDKRREEVLRNLPEAYRQRRMVEERAAEGVVESPAPLGDEELGRLASALSKMLDKTIHLRNEVVPDLIAGVRVTADNRMIDNSARGRLDGLKRSMLAAPLPSAPGGS